MSTTTMATSPDNGFALPNQNSYRWKCCAGSKGKHKNSVDGTNLSVQANNNKNNNSTADVLPVPDSHLYGY